MRPVAVVEGTGFVNLLLKLDPAYQIPSRKHIMKVLHDMYDEAKAQLQEELVGVEHAALTGHHVLFILT